MIPGDPTTTGKFVFAQNFLGPIYAEYCRRLWLFQEVYSKDDACTLFCARGGLRLRSLYEIFLKKMDLEQPIDCHNFLISRLLASKVCFQSAPDIVLKNIEREFSNSTLGEVARSMMPSDFEDVSEILSPLDKEPVNSENIKNLFSARMKRAIILKNHLREQTELFEKHLGLVTMNKHKAILVDTGLFGSTQLLLSYAYQDIEWTGYYIARSNYRKDDAPHFNLAQAFF